MLNSILENLNQIISKPRCYDTFQILIDDQVDYDSITRKKMMNQIINLYKESPEIINYIFNKEELEVLYSLPDEIDDKDFEIVLKFTDFFLYCTNSSFNGYTISQELKDVISKAKDIYLDSKERIEKEKEYQYIAVGIFRTYGALTPKEFASILDKLKMDKKNFENDNYYFKRFVSFDEYNTDRCVLTLKDLMGYSEELIVSHPKDIRLANNGAQFKDIGCYYFDIKSPHYINAIKHNKIKEFFNDTDLNEFVIYSGCGIASNMYIYHLDKFFSSLSNNEKNAFSTLFDCMPKFILNKNTDNVLSEEDGDLFYKILMPFLKYVGKKYGLPFEFYENKYNGFQANEILQKCVQDNFKYINEYINHNALLDEEVSILNNLRNFVKGPFVIIKHQKNGSIFMDSQNKLYLVKGIKSPIERMSELEVTPTICDTFIFQFKDSIIYSSIIFPSQIRIVGNMKREYLNIYNKNKNKIIKRIV